MGVASAFVVLCLRLSVVTFFDPVAGDTIEVDWSKTKFGPDGPWQAVNIALGANYSNSRLRWGDQSDTTVAVYPGGEYDSMSFQSSSCSGYSSNCGKGGFWNPTDDQISDQYIFLEASWIDKSSGYLVSPAQRLISGIRIREFIAYNTTLSTASVGNVTYQNGKVGGVPLGRLSLGAAETAQVFTTGSEQGNQIDGYTFAGKMFEQGNISSYSYGLHVGSAAFDYPGSLVFGGYNRGRVIDPVYSFTDQNAVKLLDITIGVATGSSPFSFASQDKLLTSTLTVKPDPLAPYLSLPRAVCDKLASNLPVTFDNDLKYYIWNTNDPNYEKIVSSPAYLGFKFPEVNGQPVIIKVPFALLNLTLESPITETPKQYFPCVPAETDGLKLGRAFLQAAFLGRNWKKGTSWLAQAPGPGSDGQGLVQGQIETIASDAGTISGYPNSGNRDQLVDSWSSRWKVIDSSGNQGNGTQTGSGGGNDVQTNNLAQSSGLSTGAKAGIGVGAGVGALILLAAFVIWRKRSAKKRHSKVELAAHDANGHHASPHQNEKQQYSHQGHNGWNNNAPAAELAHSTQHSPVELGDNTRTVQH